MTGDVLNTLREHPAQPGQAELRDSGGTLRNTFSSSSAFTGTTAFATAGGTNQTGLSDASTTSIRLRIGAKPNTGSSTSAAVTLRQDWVVVTVTYTLSVNVSATGVSGTGAIGTATVTGDANTSPTGVSATAALGEVTVTTGTPVDVNAEGVSATATVGSVTVTADANTNATGLSATASLGTVTVTGAANTSPSGLSSTAAVGTVTVEADGEQPEAPAVQGGGSRRPKSKARAELPKIRYISETLFKVQGVSGKASVGFVAHTNRWCNPIPAGTSRAGRPSVYVERQSEVSVFTNETRSLSGECHADAIQNPTEELIDLLLTAADM